MDIVLWCFALGLTVVLAIPTIIYSFECLAGSLPARATAMVAGSPRPPIAVVVPAHDEELGLAATLRSIRAQMRDGDRLLVVADNCRDRTAVVARSEGAEVLERWDPVKRGKGYALDHALAHLTLSPLPVVVFIDADCTLVDGTLDELARVTAWTARPVQSCYLMTTQAAQKASLGVAEFAFRVKNLVRPRALARLGLPCMLTGSGMALPWALVGKAQLAHRHLVEDMKLGVDLAMAGYAPLYCETVGVRSSFPETAVGTSSQRSRWENGHLAMIMASLASLFTRRVLLNRDCLAMMLDLMVPPMTLLCLAQVVVTTVGLVVGLLGLGWMPFTIGITGVALIIVATGVAWAVHGRDAVPLRTALKIPGYMLAKAWIYPRALFGRVDHLWIRTDRNRA